MDVGHLVDMLDGDEPDDPAAATASEGARMQPCIFGLPSVLKCSFLTSCKRAPIPDFSLNLAPTPDFSLNLGLEACSLSAFG